MGGAVRDDLGGKSSSADGVEGVLKGVGGVKEESDESGRSFKMSMTSRGSNEEIGVE